MPWLLAALLGGYLYINGAATPEKAAELAQAALQKRYPGSQVQVHVEGRSGRNVLKGKFRVQRIKIFPINLIFSAQLQAMVSLSLYAIPYTRRLLLVLQEWELPSKSIGSQSFQQLAQGQKNALGVKIRHL